MNTSPRFDQAIDSIAVSTLGSGIVVTKFVGRSTRVLSEAAYLEFERLVAGMERPIWVSDATGLTGFEARSLAHGPRWFATFRERGGRECLVVSAWDKAIMAASTMALGLGVRIQNFRTLEDARDAATRLLQAQSRDA